MTRPNLIRRLQAVFRGQGSEGGLLPAQQQSERMPDLERWTMPHRSVDMTDWEVAKNMAINVHRPDRARLMDLYDSILVDAHLASAMESRVLRVVRSKYRLVKNGEPQPKLLPLLQQPWFEDLLQYVAEAPFRGHTLIELGELTRPGELRRVNRIDPRNVLPWSGVVVRRQGEETGYPFREAPLNAYLLEVGRAEDLGLLAEVAPVAIVKKYAVGSWSDYVHKFGIPPRWVRTSSRSAHRIKQLEEMMQRMLSSAYGVIEGDEEIQVMQTPGTDAHKVFDELIARMNSEISKRLLGQDGTSDNKDASGTYGSLKVLQGVAEDRHQADKAAAAYVVNNELFPRLTALGYPFTGVRFEWDEFQDMAPTELVDAVSKLGLVFDIDPDFVAERTGIKILGARRMPGELAPGGNPPGKGRQGGNKPGPPEEEEDDDEDEDGDGVTAMWPRNELPVCGVCGGVSDFTASGELPELSDEDKQAIFEDLKATDGLFSQHYFGITADALKGGFAQAWEGNPFDHENQPDPVAYTVMEANIYKFSASKTQALALDINAMARNAKGYADFKRQVDTSGLFGVYGKHLRTEYANAVNSGMQASRYFAHKRMADSMPMWRYDTMADGRVRSSHWNLHGRVFMHNDRIWNIIYPPNGWGCRCTVIPTGEYAGDKAVPLNSQQASQYLDAKEMARMRAGGFDTNRAKLGEVFKLDASYKTGQQGAAAKAVHGLVENYGANAPQQEYSAIMARPLPAAAQPFSNVTQARVGVFRGAKEVAIRDYAGRPWRLTQDNFDYHTGAKYASEGRYRTAHLIAEVMAEPDEVWLMGSAKPNTPGQAQYKYIRYYEGQAVVVEARATLEPRAKPDMSIYTWHESTGAQLANHRKGRLIKKNTR